MTIRRSDDVSRVSFPVLPPAAEAAPAQSRAANVVPESCFEASPAQSATAARVSQPTPGFGGSIAVASGPIPLDSPEAKVAIQKSIDAIGQQGPVAGGFGAATGRGGGSFGFTARSVETDQLGMTHVRLDRTYDGVPVFGEQVISHLGRDGQVRQVNGDDSLPDISEACDKPNAIRSDQAVKTAVSAFQGKPEGQPVVEKVIAKNAGGQYVQAFRVQLQQLSGTAPKDMNYLVDASSGKLLKSWNQLDTFLQPEDFAAAATKGSGSAAAPITVTASQSPNAPIADMGTTGSVIHFNENFPIEQAKLDLDVTHSYRGDLVVTLTSPSGKSQVLSNREGGSTDDIKGSFDLSGFKGESTQGDWKLTVEDKARQDVGTLNSWGLSLTGKGDVPPQPPNGAADDTTLYSGKIAINDTAQADGTFKLADASRGNGVLTRDANNAASRTGATDMFDNNSVWGETTDPSRNAAAVDAQYGGQQTYDFYKNVLGRDSIDGKGGELVSNVHINKDYVNAFWDHNQMNYGDGDGKNASALTSLDIAGHEITHGLTERTAGLIYSGESGGINESMSDIMGKGVEWMSAQQNPNVKFSWGVGETVWTPGTAGDALRYMNDPTKDNYSVDNYKNYPKQTEVHGSSGIMNNAFTLLVEGGKNKTSGITVQSNVGMDKALKIYGRALTQYMTPSTTFAQAREACLSAATDLYGASSPEVTAVKESWHAVGVG